jgi:hypothetical protein
MSERSEEDVGSRIFSSPKSRRKSHWIELEDSSIPPEILSSSATARHSLANLEQRLQTCNVIYALANDVNTIRERERQFREGLVSQCLQQLSELLAAIENTLSSIPSVVKDVVAHEFSEIDVENQLENEVRASYQEFTEQLDRLEDLIAEKEKVYVKALKSIKRELDMMKLRPKNQAALGHLEAQVSDLSQKQLSLNSLFDALKNRPH